MSPEEYNEESRSALAEMTDAERVTACQHSFGRHGGCYFCPATAEDEGFQ